jgi:hypothetical protein
MTNQEAHAGWMVAISIICRKGIFDPKTLANRDTGYPCQEMQFLAAGQKNSNLFSQEYKKYSEEIRRNREKN